MMQHKGALDNRISEKGWRILAKDDSRRALQARCIEMASARYASESTETAAWYCMIVASGREKAVEKAMLEAGIEVCVPMRMGPERRRQHKVIPPVSMPVMTGYIMVRCVWSGYAASAIHAFEHVEGMVGGWDGRHAIPDEKMNHFIKMAEDGLFDWDRPKSLFRAGMMVEVTGGPFATFQGHVVSIAKGGKGDAVVELAVFGRTNPVMIPLAILRPL